MDDLPQPSDDLEARAKEEMDGRGYRHWMACRRSGMCPACDRPLPAEGDRKPKDVVRGIHRSCYVLTLRYRARGDWTLEERVREGKIDPVLDHPISAEARRRSQFPVKD